MGPPDGLRAVLEVRPVGDGHFEAGSAADGAGTVVFGGQVMAQSLLAATRTVTDKQVLSLHTIFARGASTETALGLEVEEMHRGHAFASVTVTVAQAGRTCARTLVLLHEPSPDLIRHADAAPRVPPPESAPVVTAGPGWWERRIVDGVDLADPAAVGPPELRLWSRFPDAPGDLAVAQALLAYASDGFLIGTAMRPHPGVGQSMAHARISTTVLAHTVAFHEPFRGRLAAPRPAEHPRRAGPGARPGRRLRGRRAAGGLVQPVEHDPRLPRRAGAGARRTGRALTAGGGGGRQPAPPLAEWRSGRRLE